MTRRKIPGDLKWLLILALVLLLLVTAISCAPDLIGPQFNDEKEEDDDRSEDGDPGSGDNVYNYKTDTQLVSLA